MTIVSVDGDILHFFGTMALYSAGPSMTRQNPSTAGLNKFEGALHTAFAS